MELRNKVIYIVSHEEWGDMFMSKHHYAVELAKKDNLVYFINHPDRRQRYRLGEVRVEATRYPGIFSVHNRLFFPFFLKEKHKRMYNFLTRIHLKRVVRSIGKKPDVIWHFDPENSLPFKCFPPAEANIYMPVDGPFNHEDELLAVERADIIVSVTDIILERYKQCKLPMLRVNHGVSQVFINETVSRETNTPLRIGYSGSLVRADLDMDMFLEVVRRHPDKIFEFWGENNYKKSTIHNPQDIPLAVRTFLETLKQQSNVIMHGAVGTDVLAAGLRRMDALFICYNIKNDQNHHKVLEYLGSGKVIVSSYMSSYEGTSGLIEMLPNRPGNEGFLELFDSVVSRIDHYNSPEKQQHRMAYAVENTYRTQINKIENFFNKSVRNS
jgi:hypothetical protein